jgi:hypothetical protein
MAVVSTFKRIKHSVEVPIFDEICAVTLTGTYATGGFTWNPFAIVAGPGSSPLVATGGVLTTDFYSPLGYIYTTTVAGSTATTKIFTAANTELANTTAVPDAALTVVIKKAR